MSKPCLLIGDLGGTNARFALAESHGRGFTDVITLAAADYASPEAAIRDYLQRIGDCHPDAICLGVAGPISDQVGRFTNIDWTVSGAELSASLGVRHVRLLNDFEAIAWAIPGLGADDIMPVGDLQPRLDSSRDYTVAVIGPGTGLGTAGLLRRDGRVVPVASEFQHGGFAPESRRQIEVLNVIRERFDRVSSERLACGSGLENVYWALTRLRNEPRQPQDAAGIFRLCINDKDPLAIEAVNLFYEVLGQVAGDLALAFQSVDGVFVAGGIAARYPDQIVASPFRLGFENKGRYRAMMEGIPTALIVHPQPGLLGAAQCAAALLV